MGRCSNLSCGRTAQQTVRVNRGGVTGTVTACKVDALVIAGRNPGAEILEGA